ncbi:class D sortase [Petrocella sp. FN5]|uniref:class D sortase n=1 Tax=Petrocella sp. FN5 TaxID=3032002 RepID=UPI0023DA3CE5|nr:class D sortase [Petrocella sp. FN5]MDF1616472.1 class D sortase [Petrocella sp. FN5]
MKKHIGTLLIIVGIVIITVPLVGRYIATQRQEALLADFLEQSIMIEDTDSYDDLSASLEWGVQEENQEDLSEALEVPGVSSIDDEGLVEDDLEGNLEETVIIKQRPKAVAILEIDKIGIKLPVAEGVDLATLKFAVGHMPETAALGSIGNAVVAGHRSHSFGTYFNRLNEVEIGDTIKVTTGGQTYIYEVYETRIVEPDDLSVLRGSSNHKVITLITCHPLYTSTHRLIVHGVIK